MMPVPSVHCEARKIAYRQSKDGLVVSFVIHPSDMPDALAVAPLGQRYMLALAAIGDDEEPESDYITSARILQHQLDKKGRVAPATTASERGKAAYAAASDMEKARLRSVLLAKDARFRSWAIPVPRDGHNRPTAVEAAEQYIRETCCAGESRRLIAEDRACYDAFLKLEARYMEETGLMAVPR